MSKQLVIAALVAVEQRVISRGNFYSDEGRTARVLTCSQLAYELRVGDVASFHRCWRTINSGQWWEAANDALGEVMDELGLENVDQLVYFATA